MIREKNKSLIVSLKAAIIGGVSMCCRKGLYSVGTGKLARIGRKMDGDEYSPILEEKRLEMAKVLKLREMLNVWQINYPDHAARATMVLDGPKFKQEYVAKLTNTDALHAI